MFSQRNLLLVRATSRPEQGTTRERVGSDPARLLTTFDSRLTGKEDCLRVRTLSLSVTLSNASKGLIGHVRASMTSGQERGTPAGRNGARLWMSGEASRGPCARQ
jgi:hypothetical protein